MSALVTLISAYLLSIDDLSRPRGVHGNCFVSRLENRRASVPGTLKEIITMRVIVYSAILAFLWALREAPLTPDE